MKTAFKQEEIIKQVLEAIDCVLVTDINGKIIYINKNHAQVLGIELEEVFGKHVQDIIPNTRMHLVAESGKEEIGSIFQMKNGQTIICNRLPIKKDGVVIGAVAVTTFRKIDELGTLLEQIKKLNLEICHYKKELRELRGAKYSYDNIIGTTPEIQKLKLLIKNVAQTKSTVLIVGDTGTGKELFAHSLHDLSPRRYKPFIRLNCAAIPEHLLESELFGYEEGAFTGAKKGGKPGKFELANNGSLLLDEINQLPLPLQSKLLRVIQEKEIERVGSVRSKEINVRLICTTNQILLDLVNKGYFREDLYYRINVVEINIPPLRERMNDLELLVNCLVEKINRECGVYIKGVDSDVLELFKTHHWPGNVRELEHTLERAANIVLTGNLKLEHFTFMSILNQGHKKTKKNEESLSLEEIKVKAEKEAIIKVLANTKGNKKLASDLLKIDRSVLYDKIRKYQIF